MAIINAISLVEAEKIAKSDKMVQSGQFKAQVHPVMLVDLSAVKTEYPDKSGN
jgi:hypothetical protein